jgi:hypothetical protein
LIEPNSLCKDTQELPCVVIGWQNLSGILVVLFEGIEEVTCQCCGLCMIEVKLHHTAGRNRALNWDSRLGRGEVEAGIRDDRGVSMTVVLHT